MIPNNEWFDSLIRFSDSVHGTPYDFQNKTVPNVVHAVDVVDVAVEEADPRTYEHESPARRNARSD